MLAEAVRREVADPGTGTFSGTSNLTALDYVGGTENKVRRYLKTMQAIHSTHSALIHSLTQSALTHTALTHSHITHSVSTHSHSTHSLTHTSLTHTSLTYSALYTAHQLRHTGSHLQPETVQVPQRAAGGRFHPGSCCWKGPAAGSRQEGRERKEE